MEMELFTAAWFSALLSIVLIDLVLAGDNAIVIGMASRNLPKEQQKKAILWGTAGAIGIRVIATFLVVYLLKIPGLLLGGGLLLIWIAYKMLTDEKDHDNVKAGQTLGAAIRTIIIADAVMGIDNVLAIAGASHGSMDLVILGLLISVPVVVFGSTLILKWMERWPILLYIGAAVLAYTAGSMITDEPLLADIFDHAAVRIGVIVAIILGVVGAGRLAKQKRVQQSA